MGTAPNGYFYTFTVDGVTVADPVNPDVKLRQRTSASLLEIPATPPALWEPRDVPCPPSCPRPLSRAFSGARLRVSGEGVRLVNWRAVRGRRPRG
jgi:hypothetical protein